MHLIMHGVLTAGLLRQFWPSARPAELIMAAAAFGGLSGLAWEIAEYFAFMRHGVELTGAYLDTMGDLSGGMTGALLAGIALSIASKHQRQASSSGPRSNRRSHSAAASMINTLTTR